MLWKQILWGRKCGGVKWSWMSSILLKLGILIVTFLFSCDARNSDGKVDLAMLRKQALDFGSLVVNFISKEMSQTPTTGGESRGARGLISELTNNYKLERKEGEGEGGGGGGEGHRGVIDWLARLIGTQGKTLGEFLREYQVHVLYDLVFIFFKWIFFLYAGLLIP